MIHREYTCRRTAPLSFLVGTKLSVQLDVPEKNPGTQLVGGRGGPETGQKVL
jgi:hypothetical protein